MKLVPIEPPPDMPTITAETTPEEWAKAHAKLTRHVVMVGGSLAVCECGAVWTRDPAHGGDVRRNPGGS